jgi:RNA polymerase sigma factor (sigma-70 family)
VTSDRVTDAADPVEVIGFDAFYAREHHRLLALALTVCRRASDADDLVHDVLEAAYRDWSTVARREDPSAWVRRMLLNKSVSAFRRSRAELRALVRLGPAPPSHLPEVTGDLSRIWAEVQRLPRRQFQVVALRYVDDLTLAEIGEILGCSAESARTHLRRARATLGRRLNLEDPDVDR